MDKQIRLGRLVKIFLKPEILLLSLFLVSFIIYFSTMLPGVGFWDTAEFQTFLYTLDVPHQTGYPTYLLLGKIFTTIFPFGSVAWRANLLSVICGSAGIYLLSLSLYRIAKNYLLSLTGGIFLISNPYLWSVSTQADPHSLHFLFFASVFYLIVLIIKNNNTAYFPLLSLILGLSLGNHLLSVFFIPPIIILGVIKSKGLSRPILIKSAGFLLLGLSVYFLIYYLGRIKIPLTTVYTTGSFKGLTRHVLGRDFSPFAHGWTKGDFSETINYFFSISQRFFGAGIFSMSFFALLLFIITDFQLGGLWLLILAGTLIFSLRYQNGFLERYFIVPYSILTIAFTLIPLNFAKITQHLFPYNLKKYILLGNIFISLILLYQGIVNLTHFYPEKNQRDNYSAGNFAQNTFSAIAPNGVVFSWWSYSTPLWYYQKVEGQRSDIQIINANPGEWEYLAQKYTAVYPVYFIDKIGLSNPYSRLIPSGNIFRYHSR